MSKTYDWKAPAKLLHWPCDDGQDEGDVYPTLADALRAAGDGEPETAWIVTQDGDILTPGLIRELHEHVSERRRAAGRRGLFAWARAA